MHGSKRRDRPGAEREAKHGMAVEHGRQAERAGGRDVQGCAARSVSGRSEAKPGAARCRAAAAPQRKTRGSRQQRSTTRNKRAGRVARRESRRGQCRKNSSSGAFCSA